MKSIKLFWILVVFALMFCESKKTNNVTTTVGNNIPVAVNIWESVDNLNKKLTSYNTFIPKDKLGSLFKEAVKLSQLLEDKFEQLRAEAFDSDNFVLLEYQQEHKLYSHLQKFQAS